MLNTKQQLSIHYTRLPKPCTRTSWPPGPRVAAFHLQPFRRAQRSGSAQVPEENEELRRLLANLTVVA